jgi:ectoine hydroxylase-related dioxygenase (phytanoyl-CoA dioxygenase family)
MAANRAPLHADAASFDAFHRVELPARLADGNGALAHPAVEALGGLALSTSAGAFTYRATDTSVEIVAGDDAADTVIELGLDDWLGLVNDLDTAPGLFYSGRATATRGKPMRFVSWETGLRAMYHGLAPFDPETADLHALDGSPLDVEATFPFAEVDDRADELRHFLRTAGYLVVRDVFDADEIAALVAEAAVLHDEATPGDGRSWWGRNTSGDEILCRVLDANRSEAFLRLAVDERIRRLADLAPERLVERDPAKRDSVTVLWKVPDVTEGLADLPWHRDCGMGGHARNCPTIIVTVCLTEGTPEAGELRALPGSHRGGFPFVDGNDVAAPTGAALHVTAGDVSLHYSDVMHVSLPPTSTEGPHRISALLAFVPPDGGHHRGERHYNDVLLGSEDGQVAHLADRLGT